MERCQVKQLLESLFKELLFLFPKNNEQPFKVYEEKGVK